MSKWEELGLGEGPLNLKEGTARFQPTALSKHSDLRDVGAFNQPEPCDGIFRKGADMFAGSQNAQFARANQLKRHRNSITIRDVSTVLQSAAVVLVTLFLAGIAAPSFLRSEAAGSHALASGSLHTLTVARIPFTYTFWNLASALLGALFGAAAVMVISRGSIARIGRAICQMPWKSLFAHRKSRPSHFSGYLMK